MNKFMKKTISMIVVTVITAVTIVGCGNKSDDKKEAVQSKELNVICWSEYLPEQTLNEYEASTGTKVNMTTYTSPDEMLAKVDSSPAGTYDLIITPENYTTVLSNKNVLEKLDKQKLPNISNINPNYLGRENDPQNTYSIPYMFASTVIAINKDKISDKITSYKDLLNPKYKDSIVVVEDPRALVAMAAMATGHDVNDAKDSSLKDDGEYLKKLMPNIHAFNGDSPKTLMINGECSIGLIYGAEVALAQEQNPSIQAVYPEEGVYLGADMFMITAAAKNKENAYNFVNYILDSKVSAEISKIYPYINPNKGAQEYLPDSYKQNILKNVPSEVFSRACTLKDLGGDNSKIVDLFMKVKDSK